MERTSTGFDGFSWCSTSQVVKKTIPSVVFARYGKYLCKKIALAMVKTDQQSN